MSDKESMEKLSNTLVDVETVANIFGIKRNTVYVWVKRGVVEAVEIKFPGATKGTTRIKSSSVKRLLGIEDQVSA